jgi:regulator of replication initiation timing
MVSRPGTIPFRLFITFSEPTKKEILEQLAALEEENQRLQQEDEQVREENERLREENKRFRAKLRWHEGPHAPQAKNT